MKRQSTHKVLMLARKHLGQNSSARVCMSDAIRAIDRGDIDRAERMALRSLAHSVGILHADYSAAFHASGIEGNVHLVSPIKTKEDVCIDR